MHRRLVNPTLATFNGDRAQYFCGLVDLIERDPRTENFANLIYLVLKETIPYLNTALPESDLAEQLFTFVEDNRTRFNKILFDTQYLLNPALFSNVTKEFVLTILTSSLSQHTIDEAEIASSRLPKLIAFHGLITIPIIRSLMTMAKARKKRMARTVQSNRSGCGPGGGVSSLAMRVSAL